MHIDGRENTWCICSLIYWPLSILCYEENDKFVYVCRISMNNNNKKNDNNNNNSFAKKRD